MDIHSLIKDDVWEVIKNNYEKGSYTTSITNLMQYINEIVREKSELSLDNTKLMDAAFLGQNPKLKINKFQTDTEKDIQSGVGYLLKGLCLAIRNPRAHERFNDKKETADLIILFIDYILDFVRNSKQPALVEDWLEFVFNENFNSTKEYSDIVLKEIPEKKRYDLLVSIFRNREKAKKNSLNNLINKLINIIKPEELIEFYDNLNKELLYCSDNMNLKMFLNLFPPEKWVFIIPLAKLRVENMVKNSIENGIKIPINFGEFDEETEYVCNDLGELATWAVNHIKYFETNDDILQILGEKLSNSDFLVRDYVISYFAKVIFDYNNVKHSSLVNGIKKSLKFYDRTTYDVILYLWNKPENIELKEMFTKEMQKAKDYFASQDLPF